MTSPSKPAHREVLCLIAHRGESEDFPENTLPAFEEAMAAGAGLVECDIHLCADGELVVIHDATLDRTTDRKGEVAQLALKEICMASAGYPKIFGSRFPHVQVPTLDEVLDLVRHRARLLIEIKPESMGRERPAAVVRALLELLKKRRMTEQVALISFDPEALRQCRQGCPEIKTGLIFYQWPKGGPLPLAQGVAADFMVLNKALVGKKPWRDLDTSVLPLGAYVVDRVKEIGPLYAAGIRGIATNRFRKMVAELRDSEWKQSLDLKGDTFFR
jgi:glycerophosphoryl diester phosphodiesterase